MDDLAPARRRQIREKSCRREREKASGWSCSSLQKIVKEIGTHEGGVPRHGYNALWLNLFGDTSLNKLKRSGPIQRSVDVELKRSRAAIPETQRSVEARLSRLTYFSHERESD